MKNKKSFLICMILLAIFTLGVVCAEDNATSDNYTIENTQDDIVSVENIANENNIKESVGDKDYNSYYSSNSTLENKGEDIDLADYYLIYSLDPIYPWSWADNDGDSGPGIDIYLDTYGKYNISGNTTIYLNDKLIDEISGEFYYLIDEYTLWNNYNGKGTYTVKLAYSGDDNFKPTNVTSDFELSSYICRIENGILYLTLPSNIYGNLTINVNGTTITRKINATYATYLSYSAETHRIELEGLKSCENYTAEIDFKGNSKICTFTESINFNYNKTCPIDILLIDDNGYYYSYEYHNGDYFYGKNNFIIFSVPKDIKNNVDLTIDGKSYSYEKINGDISYYGNPDYDIAFKADISDLETGNHSIVVSYPGDSKYPSDFKSTTINVHTEIEYVDYEGYRSLSLYLPSDAMGNFTVEIKHYDESDYILFDTFELKGQNAIIQLPCGEYDIKSYYTGSDYVIKEIIGPEYVSPLPIAMNYGQNKQLRMPNAINSTIKFAINLDEGHTFIVGEFTVLNYSALCFNDALIDELLKSDEAKRRINQNYDDYGSYFLEFTPRINYNNSYFELHPIKVNFIPPKITSAKDIEMYYGDSKSIILKVYDIYGKLVGENQAVKIKIGKNTISVKTDKNGVAKFKIPNTITPGKYTITMTYKNAKVPKKLTVKQVLTLKAVKVKKSAKKLTLTATLKKGKKAIKNAKVTFKFNGKTYKAKTNSKGIAKVTIKKSVLKKLKAGKKLTYSATYLKNTVKKTVKIQK